MEIEALMRTALKILFTGLLLLLVLAIGAEVVALHRSALAPTVHPAHPLVVRKAFNSTEPAKTVQPGIR